MVVEGLFYTKEHEWVKIQGDTATIGVTDYAQQMLGEITFVELPAVNKEVESNGELAVVESSKAASDVYAPMSGRITQVNSQLESKPELINQDCYRSGWICRLSITDSKTVYKLMDAKQYEQYLKGL